jgi:hypothetical protein
MNLKPDEAKDLCVLWVNLVEIPSRTYSIADHKCLFELEIEDIQSCFGKFGLVTEIFLFPSPNANKCFVTMSSIPEAFYAARVLNNTLIKDGNFLLRVKFVCSSLDKQRLQEFVKTKTE